MAVVVIVVDSWWLLWWLLLFSRRATGSPQDASPSGCEQKAHRSTHASSPGTSLLRTFYAVPHKSSVGQRYVDMYGMASRAGVERTTIALTDVEHGDHVPPPAKIAAVARLAISLDKQPICTRRYVPIIPIIPPRFLFAGSGLAWFGLRIRFQRQQPALVSDSIKPFPVSKGSRSSCLQDAVSMPRSTPPPAVRYVSGGSSIARYVRVGPSTFRQMASGL
jgi:hypothetical protein